MLSKNAAGLITLALSLVGLEIGEDTILEVIASLTTVVSFGMMVYNQINRPDVEGFFWKK